MGFISSGFQALNNLFNAGVTETDNNYGFSNYSYINPKFAQNYYDSIMQNQQAIWDREDSAIQRQVADMKKAGLNPWTAVGGSGAPTSSSNASQIALDGLLSLLSLNNNAIKLKDSDEKWTVDTVKDTLLSFLKIGKALM